MTKYIRCELTKDIPDTLMLIHTDAMIPEQFAQKGKLVDIWQWGRWSKNWVVAEIFADVVLENDYLVRFSEDI